MAGAGTGTPITATSAAYTTVAAVKAYLGISASTEDGLLGTLITAAQSWLEKEYNRLYAVSADTTRYLDAVANVDGRRLLLPYDLCQITTVTNLGVSVAASEYTTHPRHATPWYALELKTSSTVMWDYLTDPADAIVIVGRWGYSITPPDFVVQACTRLTAYLYRQKDASTFDVTAQPDMGLITIPQGIPTDVRRLMAGQGNQL